MGILFDLAPRPSLAESFVAEEQLALSASPQLRLWTHGRALVAGSRDGRLPDFERARSAYCQQGWEMHLRTSGGGLVVLDEGVLNVSLAWRQEALPSLEAGYATMRQVLSVALGRLGVDAVASGEVAGSLCPGRSDLSIDNRKLAGISQRRRRQFLLVHAFVLVSGRADDRITTGRSFYQLAGGRPELVVSGTMCTVSEATGQPVPVESLAAQVAEAAQGAVLGL